MPKEVETASTDFEKTREEYPRPALTVDCVVFGLDAETLKVLLIERDLEPYRGEWALPGGFVRMTESLEEAARRELKEEAGIDQVYLEQLYTFGNVDRDPRGRVVTVSYYALVRPDAYHLQASTDARHANWFPLQNRPRVAFDHELIIRTAYDRLKNKVQYQPLGFELLPQKFPLRDLQRLYELILDRELDKRNFRKKILSMGILDELNEKENGVAHRAAQLYRFNRKEYQRRVKQGFHFEL